MSGGLSPTTRGPLSHSKSLCLTLTAKKPSVGSCAIPAARILVTEEVLTLPVQKQTP